MTLLAALAYLCGCFPTAALITRALKGVDIKKVGSGNPGAANVFAVAGFKPALATSIIDALKGFLPVLLAQLLYPAEPRFWALAGGCAVAGHVWPVFWRFQGGKGLATSFGILLLLCPPAAWCGLAAAIAGLLLSGYAVVGSMATVAVGALAIAAWRPPAPVQALAAGLAAVIVLRHRSNLQRLLRGEEDRLPSRQAKTTAQNRLSF